MSFHKLLKLADKFKHKYLIAQAPAPKTGTDSMTKIVNAVNAMYQMSIYLQALPHPNYNVVSNGEATVHNFNTYYKAIEDNLAPYYDPDTRQYTPLYVAQKRLPSPTVALIKKQLLESLPFVSAVGSIIWFNNQEPNVRATIDSLSATVRNNAGQITLF